MGRALDIQIPSKMLPFLTPMRHKVARGGRGGGKSHTVAKLLIAKMIDAPIRWLCTREIQKSIKDSVHKLLADQIRAMNVGYHFDVQATTIKAYNGGEFLFAGLQDHAVDSIKSSEGCDGAWIEEAHRVSQRSAEVLVPTIRAPGSELWWTYNPDATDDYVHKRFVIDTDPNALVVEINWRDNPWFPPELELERRQLLAINRDLYDHVWEGHCRSVAGLLFKRVWFRRYPVGQHPEFLNRYLASDFAAPPDPDDPDADPDYTELGAAGLAKDGHLWMLDWWDGPEDASVWVPAYIDMVRRHKPRIAFEEKGVILRALDASVRKAFIEANPPAWVHREALASAGDKASRALGFAARASMGTVHIPECAWGDALVDQLCAFTGQDGRRDDKVDVCSLLARGLDMMANASVPEAETRKPVIPFTRQHIEAIERDEAEAAQSKKRHYR